MKFSVIIPLYNKAPYIRGTIDSVLAQTCQDFEIVVVDDGSTDGSADILDTLTDPRLRVVRQPNAGVSAARNRAISMANGQWVAFLDADDWHHPQYLASLVLAQDMHPEADIVATQYMPVEDTINVWPPMPALPAKPLSVELINDLPERWMKGPTFTTSSVCIRTALLQEMHPCFAVGESHGEDLDMWFRAAERSPIALVMTPLVAYRISVEGSLSLKNPTLTLPPFLARLRKRARAGTMPALKRRSALKLVANQEISMARDALASGQRVEAIRLLCSGHDAKSSVRWWSTAAMTVFVPGGLVRRWQLWRVQRALPTMSAG